MLLNINKLDRSYDIPESISGVTINNLKKVVSNYYRFTILLCLYFCVMRFQLVCFCSCSVQVIYFINSPIWSFNMLKANNSMDGFCIFILFYESTSFGFTFSSLRKPIYILHLFTFSRLLSLSLLLYLCIFLHLYLYISTCRSTRKEISDGRYVLKLTLVFSFWHTVLICNWKI